MKKLAAALIILVGSALPALAGPTYTFSTSSGVQPSNAGVITLTQSGANSVVVKVDLQNGPPPPGTPSYGFINTGGPTHTPLGFELNVSSTGLSISSWTTPSGGVAPNGTFTLNTSGDAGFNTSLDYSGGNGSSSGYFGDLVFTLTRTGGLSTDNFVSNGVAYFVADLSNGSNTGSQFWNTRVPEPMTLSLFGAGIAGVALLRRRKKAA